MHLWTAAQRLLVAVVFSDHREDSQQHYHYPGLPLVEVEPCRDHQYGRQNQYQDHAFISMLFTTTATDVTATQIINISISPITA